MRTLPGLPAVAGLDQDAIEVTADYAQDNFVDGPTKKRPEQVRGFGLTGRNS